MNDKERPTVGEIGKDEDPNEGTPLQGATHDRTWHGIAQYGYSASGSVLTQSGLENN